LLLLSNDGRNRTRLQCINELDFEEMEPNEENESKEDKPPEDVDVSVPFFEHGAILFIGVQHLKNDYAGLTLKDNDMAVLARGEELGLNDITISLWFEDEEDKFFFLYDGPKLVWKWRYCVVSSEDWKRMKQTQ